MDDLITDSRYSWVRLGLTLFVATVINAGMWAIIVIMPAIEAEYGGTRAMVSLPYTLTMVGFAFGNYVIGRAVDHFGITASLIVAAIMTAIGFILATLSSSLLILSFTQLMVGFASAVGFGPLIADISHWFVRRRGIAVAIAASGNYLSGAIWPILLAKVLAENGWRAVYIVMAAVTLFAVIPLALALRRRLPQQVQTAAQNTSLANAKTVGLSPRALQYLLGFAGIGCCVAMSMPQVHIVAYCVDLGFGPAVGAQMLSSMLFFGVVSILLLLFSYFFAEQILYIFGVEYMDYADSFLILIMGIVGIYIFRGLFGNLLSSIGKIELNYYIISIAIVINVISNYYLIPLYGIKGAAITSAILMWFTGILSWLSFLYFFRKNRYE